MILFINNNVGFMFLSYEQIVIPLEVVPSHGYGGVTPERASVKVRDLLFEQIIKEDEEMVILVSQIIIRHGTFGLS